VVEVDDEIARAQFGGLLEPRHGCSGCARGGTLGARAEQVGRGDDGDVRLGVDEAGVEFGEQGEDCARRRGENGAPVGGGLGRLAERALRLARQGAPVALAGGGEDEAAAGGGLGAGEVGEGGSGAALGGEAGDGGVGRLGRLRQAARLGCLGPLGFGEVEAFGGLQGSGILPEQRTGSSAVGVSFRHLLEEGAAALVGQRVFGEARFRQDLEDGAQGGVVQGQGVLDAGVARRGVVALGQHHLGGGGQRQRGGVAGAAQRHGVVDADRGDSPVLQLDAVGQGTVGGEHLDDLTAEGDLTGLVDTLVGNVAGSQGERLDRGDDQRIADPQRQGGVDDLGGRQPLDRGVGGGEQQARAARGRERAQGG
jgi:hypothetical protein